MCALAIPDYSQLARPAYALHRNTQAKNPFQCALDCVHGKPCMQHDWQHVLLCRERSSTVRAFLSATARGYEMAAAHPQRASALLVEESRGALDAQFALSSQAYASKVAIILPGLQSPVRHCIFLFSAWAYVLPRAILLWDGNYCAQEGIV